MKSASDILPSGTHVLVIVQRHECCSTCGMRGILLLPHLTRPRYLEISPLYWLFQHILIGLKVFQVKYRIKLYSRKMQSSF